MLWFAFLFCISRTFTAYKTLMYVMKFLSPAASTRSLEATSAINSCISFHKHRCVLCPFLLHMISCCMHIAMPCFFPLTVCLRVLYWYVEERPHGCFIVVAQYLLYGYIFSTMDTQLFTNFLLLMTKNSLFTFVHLYNLPVG